MPSESLTRILTLIPRSARVPRLESFLTRSRIRVQETATAEEALRLLATEPFDLATASLPLPDMSVGRLVTEVRDVGHSENTIPLILMARSPQLEAARVFESPWVRVLGLGDDEETIRAVIAEALGIATRLSVRIPIRLEIGVGEGPTLRFCETRNLSGSGMLISSGRPLPIGSTFTFELTLPLSVSPLEGSAEVVRHSDPRLEDTTGFGARFLDLDTEQGSRLRHFLQSEDRSSLSR